MSLRGLLGGFREAQRALMALGETGLFRPAPLKSVLQLAWCVLRHGVSLYTLAAWNAWRWPDRLAVAEHGADGSAEEVSCQELRRRADLFCAALAAHTSQARMSGVASGVALLCRNHVGFVALLLACSRLGLRTVLLNTSFVSEQVRAACWSQGATLLVCDDEFEALLAGAELTGLNMISVSALVRSPPARTPVRRPTRSGRATLVLLTSGTAGQPRAVPRRLSLGAVLPTLNALLSSLRPQAGSPTLLTLPLFHGHGLATLGLSLTLAAPLHLFARGGPEDHWHCLTEHRIEVLVLVPTILYRLLHSAEASQKLPPSAPSPSTPSLSTPSLRTIISGSAPLNPALAVQAGQVFGPVLFNLYGSSEAGLISLATPQDLLVAPGTVGRALPGVEIRLRQPRSAQAGQGEPGARAGVGRVEVRGPLVVGNVASEAADTEFYETGDLGWFGPTGLLFLAGRQDDLLVIGGENVSPELIEDRIAQIPCVLECAVTPLPSAEYGQAVHAHIVLRSGYQGTTPADLRRDLWALLPRTLRPAEISVVQALPRNQMGKLLRSRLNPEPVESVDTEPASTEFVNTEPV